MAPNPPAGPPDEAALHAAALAYLTRFAATEAGLQRVLDRRIDRWARTTVDRDAVSAAVETAKRIAAAVVARLAASGAVSDMAFAESRARSLSRAGRSRRMVAATLAAKGISGEMARAALPDDEDTELGAALVLARKRRIGPFRTAPAGDKQRELAVLARAGFARDIALKALSMTPDDAEALIAAFRR
ncbi:MAG TPA: RecX family transcriptional regulator [Acetobacteraceae bacterium]|nr:RecX family transcriptional regulator [Acetobacteraceae bacterium]